MSPAAAAAEQTQNRHSIGRQTPLQYTTLYYSRRNIETKATGPQK